jgi:hypothetical protein
VPVQQSIQLEKPLRHVRECIFFSLCLFLIVVSYCAQLYSPFTFANFDPGWQIYGVQSLVEDGDLDLRNQLDFDSKKTGGQVAVGKEGEWYPSHEIPIIFFAVPFYSLWGINGCLLANVVISFLMGLGCFLIARLQATFPAALGASLLAFVSTPALSLTYSFSNDLFAACIFTWMVLAIMRQRYLLAGLLLGACLLSRLATVALIPAIGVYCMFFCSMRSTARVLLPLALAGACYGLLNYQMFGSPLVLAYERLFTEERDLVTTSSLYFSYTLENLRTMLLDQKQGVLFAYPLIGMMIFITRLDLRLLTYGIFIGLSLLFAGHASFDGVGGARYFLPMTPLIGLALATAIDSLVGRTRLPS